MLNELSFSWLAAVLPVVVVLLLVECKPPQVALSMYHATIKAGHKIKWAVADSVCAPSSTSDFIHHPFRAMNVHSSPLPQSPIVLIAALEGFNGTCSSQQ